MWLVFELTDVGMLIDHAANSTEHVRTGAEANMDAEAEPGLWLVRELGKVTLRSNGQPGVEHITPLVHQEDQNDEDFVEEIPISKLVHGLKKADDYEFLVLDVNDDEIKVNLSSVQNYRTTKVNS